MNILVTGKNGQLGSEINYISSNTEHSHNLIFTDSVEGDITDIKKLQKLFSTHKLDIVINCAAYTAVDKAESDIERAFEVNGKGVQNLVDICSEHDCKLIHISTDYVFNGSANAPYQPYDPVSPLGVYGASKRKGEEAILNSNTNAIIIRTSWVFSSFGGNFVKTMLRFGKEREELNVVDDQIGCPTYAFDLAKACIQITESNNWTKGVSIYHFSNSGEISWFTFAEEIMNLAKLNCRINPIPSIDYPTPVERPKYSVLDTRSIQENFNITPRTWNEALKDCLNRIK